ncbi:MAG: hypothetical protein ACOYYJ_11575 [Chloroflexota bacterium]
MTNDIELIPLAVTRSENDITLRIDKNGLCHSQFEGLPVAELKLIACRDAARVFAVLNEFIDNPVYYEVVKEQGAVTVSFQADYMSDEFRVDCDQVNETLADYTLEELKQKTNRLARLYAASVEANELSDYLYRLLKDSLSKMIQKELDLYQHKIEFFARTNPEKAATLTGQEQAYQKVLALVGLDGNGRSITPQMRGAISQIWSDHVWHQSTYAAQVESGIEEMGRLPSFRSWKLSKTLLRGICATKRF